MVAYLFDIMYVEMSGRQWRQYGHTLDFVGHVDDVQRLRVTFRAAAADLEPGEMNFDRRDFKYLISLEFSKYFF